MKIILFSDIHWSSYSSIIRQRGNKYSVRLEHLIATMNWINKVALEKDCTAMICCGDMMDKAQLTDEEITALREIKWNNLPCYFLCGNHESSVSDLRFSSLKALESENHFIISEPTIWKYNNDENEIRFLPYIVESDRKPLFDYFGAGLGKTIIISHNDIQGINYGGFESKIGFTIDEINSYSTYYFNGHLHNSEWITDRILNVGSSSAHNFTNDSSRYKYGVWILDLDTLKVEFIENPYGFNFYKFDILRETDISNLESIKTNSVLSIKTYPELLLKVKEKLEILSDRIVESKIITERKTTDLSDVSIEDLQVDHLTKFIEFCKANINNNSILDTELSEICK